MCMVQVFIVNKYNVNVKFPDPIEVLRGYALHAVEDNIVYAKILGIVLIVDTGVRACRDNKIANGLLFTRICYLPFREAVTNQLQV